jgi:hypothetical protein
MKTEIRRATGLREDGTRFTGWLAQLVDGDRFIRGGLIQETEDQARLDAARLASEYLAGKPPRVPHCR